MSKSVIEASESLCRALGDRGFVFHWEADNRGGKSSRYIFVRQPVPMKIRIADHTSDRIEKDKQRSRVKVLDVGPHAMTVEAALAEIVGLAKR